MTPYSFALELTLLLAAWLFLAAMQRERHVQGRVTYAAAAACVVLWTAGVLLAFRGETYLLGRRVAMLGMLAITPMWFGVAAHAVKLPMIRRTPWLPLLLIGPFVPLYALLYTGPWSVLFIPAQDVETVEYGPLLWWALLYGWSLVLAGTAVLIHGAWTTEAGDLRRQRLRMAASALVPLGANAVWAWRVYQTGGGGLDLTPVLLTITLLGFRRSILSGGMLEVLPVAQRDILQHLPFGVVLADDRGTVIDVNPAAEDLLEVPRAEALGRGLEAVISRAPLDVRIEVASVRGRTGESVRFALLEAPKPPPAERRTAH